MFLRTPDGYVVHYRRWREGRLAFGEEEGTGGARPTLVVVHGAMVWGTDWYARFAEQVSVKCDVLVYDQPGHGLTMGRPAEHSTFKRSVEDLRLVIDLLRLRNVVLFGASRGWCIVTDYVEQFGLDGVRGVVCEDFVPCTVPEPKQESGLDGDLAAMAYVKDNDHFAFAKRLGRLVGHNDPASRVFDLYPACMPYFKDLVVGSYADSFERSLAVLDKAAWVVGMSETVAWDGRAKFAAMRDAALPALVLHGTSSHIVTTSDARALAGLLGPNARLVAFEECSHAVVASREADCVRACLAFLAEVAPPSYE